MGYPPLLRRKWCGKMETGWSLLQAYDTALESWGSWLSIDVRYACCRWKKVHPLSSFTQTNSTRTYVHGTVLVHVLHVVHMYTNAGTFVLYMYILIHAYMYATESKVLGLDQIGVFQTTEPSPYMYRMYTYPCTGTVLARSRSTE